MKGQVAFSIRNNQISFHFVIERNITVLRGYSATGKTKLINLVRDYENFGPGRGIKLDCPYECVVIEGRNWERKLEETHNSIVFIDEGNAFLNSYEFANAAKHSSNYYVIATRNTLYQLSYSIESICEIKRHGHRPDIVKMFEHISATDIENLPYDILITEDSEAGFSFFQKAANALGIQCVSAHGKSNLLTTLKAHEGLNILLVADTAALGCEIDALLQYQKFHEDQITFFLPECFEWLVLKSGLIRNHALTNILSHPADYIECENYFSWEPFFHDTLRNMTMGDALKQYSKTRLLPYYTNPANAQKIIDAMK